MTAAALFLPFASGAQAACAPAGAIVTCTGNLQAGVALNYTAYSTLNVNTLTNNIAPASGVDGLRFVSSGQSLTVTSKLGAFQISATGSGADGIEARTTNVNNNVTVDSTGNISSAAANGIFSYSKGTGESAVTSVGNITSALAGIRAVATNSFRSFLTVSNKGNITTTGGTAITADGIYARSIAGAVLQVDSTGDITSAAAHGIYGRSADAVIVTSAGYLKSLNEGIRATGRTFSVTSTGDISSAASYGVLATATSDGTVNSTGHINSVLSGIRATTTSAIGSARITSKGNIATSGGSGASGDAIYAKSSGGSATVKSTGNVTSAVSRGIHALAGSYAGVNSSGNVEALNEGILAEGTFFKVTSVGDVASSASYGIATSSSGSAASSVSSTGAVTSLLGGVRATSTSSAAITVTNHGAITTTGGTTTSAGAIYAKSVGGALTVNSVGVLSSAKASGIAAVAGAGSVSITNDGQLAAQTEGIRASGSRFTITSAGDIGSAASYGILASATGSLADSVSNTGNVASVLGGIRATGSSTGAVSVTNHGSITTTGGTTTNAGAIYAKTAGGAVTVNSVGDLSSATSAGIATVAGAGSVSITSDGRITAQTYGIRASGQQVTVLQTGGSISSAGQSAIAVTSSGTAGVDVSGLVEGATGHASVAFENGTDNRLDIRSTATVENAGGLDELALRGGSGNEIVANAGLLAGSIDLGSGQNSLTNLVGGGFAMGQTISLGNGRLFRNDGAMSPGGLGIISNVDMLGNLQQGSGGNWLVDIDTTAGTADLIGITGTASLSGAVTVNLSSPATSSRDYTILTASDGVSHDGLTLFGTPPSSLPISYALRYPDGNSVVLSVAIDFALHDVGLNPNQTALGDNLTDVYETDPGALSHVTDGLLNVSSLTAYKSAMDQLLPETYLQAAMAGAVAAEGFSGSLLGCRDQAHASVDRSSCGWAEAGGGELSRDTTHDDIGADEISQFLGGGVETRIAPSLSLGFGGRLEQVNQDVFNMSGNTGQRGQLGAALTYEPGSLLLAAAVSGGHAWLDSRRQLAFGGFTGTAKADYGVDFIHGKLRAAYQFDMGQAFLTPMLDVDAGKVTMGDVTEHGGNGAALDVGGLDDNLLAATPRLKLGGEWGIGDGGTVFRPFASIGATFYADPGFSVSSRFRDAPPGTSSFKTRGGLDDVTANVLAGIDLFETGGSSLEISYEGRFGETMTVQTGRLAAAFRF